MALHRNEVARALGLEPTASDAAVLGEIGRLKAREALVPEVEKEWREPDLFAQRDRMYLGCEADNSAMRVAQDAWGVPGWTWFVWAPCGDEPIAQGTAPSLDLAKAEAEAAAVRLGVLGG
jgi:hypothetical protein